MYDGRQSLCFSSIREKITFNENALLRDQRKKWVLLENQHCILNIEDIFTKFTGHPMNWTNMMSSNGHKGLCEKNCLFYKRNQGSGLFWTALYMLSLYLSNGSFTIMSLVAKPNFIFRYLPNLISNSIVKKSKSME